MVAVVFVEVQLGGVLGVGEGGDPLEVAEVGAEALQEVAVEVLAVGEQILAQEGGPRSFLNPTDIQAYSLQKARIIYS